ncbi:MAG: phage tail protein [Chloroflexi bacterium]|jgi:phage tail-like protein|nr:phage tail protein [Chloroflexota bacterium]
MPKGAGSAADPLIANRFYLDISGVVIEGIQEVSGLDFETDVSETLQSMAKNKLDVVKVPGANRVKTGKLTLKYITFKDDPAAKWRADVIAGKMTDARKNISLIAFDLEGKEVLRFNFTDAWPSKRAYSNFSSKSNEPVTVTLTIEHEGVKVKGYNE